jgi:hypothetical protein
VAVNVTSAAPNARIAIRPSISRMA